MGAWELHGSFEELRKLGTETVSVTGMSGDMTGYGKEAARVLKWGVKAGTWSVEKTTTNHTTICCNFCH